MDLGFEWVCDRAVEWILHAAAVMPLVPQLMLAVPQIATKLLALIALYEGARLGMRLTRARSMTEYWSMVGEAAAAQTAFLCTYAQWLCAIEAYLGIIMCIAALLWDCGADSLVFIGQAGLLVAVLASTTVWTVGLRRRKFLFPRRHHSAPGATVGPVLEVTPGPLPSTAPDS